MLNGKLVVGYVGSLVKNEGLDYLLEAIRCFPNASQQLGRSHRWRRHHGSQLEQQAHNLGLSDMVQFTGKVPMDVVNDY